MYSKSIFDSYSHTLTPCNNDGLTPRESHSCMAIIAPTNAFIAHELIYATLLCGLKNILFTFDYSLAHPTLVQQSFVMMQIQNVSEQFGR